MSLNNYNTYQSGDNDTFASVLPENLVKALESVKNGIDSKPQLPVLANVAIIAKGGYLHFYTTNLSTIATFKIGAKVYQEFSITLPFRTFYDISKLADKLGRIDFSFDEKTQTVSISQNNWMAHLKGISIDEFPPVIFDESDNIGLLNFADFKRIAELAGRYVSKEDKRPALNKVHIVTGETWHFWASDASNYFYASMKNQAEDKSVKQFSIDGKTLADIVKSLGKTKPGEIEVSLVKDKELIQIGEFGANKPQIVQIEKSVMELPDFKRLHTARLWNMDLLQTRILKNRAKKANQFDYLSFEPIGKTTIKNSDGKVIYEGDAIRANLRVNGNDQDNHFAMELPIDGNMGSRFQILKESPAKLSYSLPEFLNLAEIIYMDRVKADDFSAVQFRVIAGDLTLICGFPCNEPGDQLKAKLSGDEYRRESVTNYGEIQAIDIADKSVMADESTGRIVGVEYVKTGKDSYRIMQFQLIDGRKAYGRIVGKLEGENCLMNEFKAIEKHAIKTGFEMAEMPKSSRVSWHLIIRQKSFLSSLSLKETGFVETITRQLIKALDSQIETIAPDYSAFLDTENCQDYPVAWEEISIETTESPVASDETMPEAENIKTGKIIAPVAEYFRQNGNMNDLIRLNTETPHDTGAFHRAIDLSRQLKAAGLWDGQTPIRFVDAYAIHTAVMGIQGLPLQSLKISLEHGEMLVNLPVNPEPPSTNSGETMPEAENIEKPELYPMPTRHNAELVPSLIALTPGRWYYADMFRPGRGNHLSLVYVRKIEGNWVYFHDTGTYDKHEAEKRRDMGEFRRSINEAYKKLQAGWQQMPAQASSETLRGIIAEGRNRQHVANPSPSPRKIALKAVTFGWSESSAYEFPLTVDSWEAAAAIVRKIAEEKRGFCDKTDVKVEWADGFIYQFRYDITGDDSLDVAGRIWDYVAAKCGLIWEFHFNPEMMAKDELLQEFRELLQNYDLNGWQDRPYFEEVEAPAIPRPEDKEAEAIPDSPYADRRPATQEERKALKAQRIDDKEAVKQIMEDLKKAFPSVKFSRRLDWATHSRSLDISWQDGPTTKEVDFILGKYASDKPGQWGDESVYWMLNTGELVHYGIRFLMTRRSYSGEFLRKLAESALAEQGITLDYQIIDDGKDAYIKEDGPASERWEVAGRSETFGYYVKHLAYNTSALSVPAAIEKAAESPAITSNQEKTLKAARFASVWEISGDTKSHKEAIKAAGGKWDKNRLAWVLCEFPESLREITSFSDLVLPLEMPIKGELRGAGFSDHWRIYGETLTVRYILKAAGFYWNGYEWILNQSALPASVRALFQPDTGGDAPKKAPEAKNIESLGLEWGSWASPSPQPPAESSAEAQNISAGASTAEKLRAAAARLEGQIAEKFKDRQTNTHRRASHDEHARNQGRSLQKIQNMLNGLAELHETDTISPILAKIRGKGDIELILFHKPSRRIYQHWVASVRKATKDNQAGLNREEMNLLGKIAVRCSGNGDEYGWIYPAELPTLRSLEKKVLKIDKFLNTHEDFERFERLGITEENYQEARQALQMLADPDGAIKASLETEAMRQKKQQVALANIPGYFPTPPDVLDKMLEWFENNLETPSILEPSAGAGHIAEKLRETYPKAKIDCIEVNEALRGILQEKGFSLVGIDFLEYQGQHDLIVMNPPFEDFQDIDHVLHAWECLNPGGRIVAIMSIAPFFREEQKAESFRQWLKSIDAYSEKLPEDAFTKSERRTGVKTQLVVLDKPQFTTMPEEENTVTEPSLYKEESAIETEEEERGDYWALISWEEGKLELHSRYSLDKEEFKALMGEGFKYVRGETIYYAPYTPWRHKYLMDNFGITTLEDDFEKHLRDRAENRADRFEGFSDNAANRGAAHHETANRISERFYMGQPILVGHHSEAKARRDQARMWNNESKWIQEQDRASYWSSRADGALRRANRRETLRAVVNRIDSLEADLRKAQRELAKIPGGKSWHYESWIWFYTNRLDYERALLAAMPEENKPDETLKIEKGGLVWNQGRWHLIEGLGSKNVVIHPYACTIKVKLATITPAKYKSPAEFAELKAANRLKIDRGGIQILEENA
jgi:DNA polymerase III sliding clamp (beta) subunit (PCNA family)